MCRWVVAVVRRHFVQKVGGRAGGRVGGWVCGVCPGEEGKVVGGIRGTKYEYQGVLGVPRRSTGGDR